MQNRELNSPDLLTRQRALMSLCDVMHNPEHISEGLRVGKYMCFFKYIDIHVQLLAVQLLLWTSSITLNDYCIVLSD